MKFFQLILVLIFINSWFYSYSNRIITDDPDAEPASILISQHYDMLIGSSKIGNFNIGKTIKGKTTEYNASSLVEVKLITSFTFNYTLQCIFENKVLKSSKFMLYRNGKKIEQTTIIWTGKDYKVNKNDEVFTIDKPIYDSAIELYFEEPENNQAYLSEKEGVLMRMLLNTSNNYNLMVPNQDREIEYIYNHHKLNEVIVDLFITEFKMVRK